MNTRYTGPDEFPISEIPVTPWWSENFAAMYSSPAERVAVFYSIGRWHSDTSIWRELLMVSLPNGNTIYSKGFARNGAKQTGYHSRMSSFQPLRCRRCKRPKGSERTP